MLGGCSAGGGYSAGVQGARRGCRVLGRRFRVLGGCSAEPPLDTGSCPVSLSLPQDLIPEFRTCLTKHTQPHTPTAASSISSACHILATCAWKGIPVRILGMRAELPIASCVLSVGDRGVEGAGGRGWTYRFDGAEIGCREMREKEFIIRRIGRKMQ